MNKALWIERAKVFGIDELEIYEQLKVNRSLSWFGKKTDSFTTSRVLGTSLRAIVNGKQAEMALEQADDAQMDEILASLAEQGRIVSSADPAALRKPEKTEKAKSKKRFVKPSVEDIRHALAETERRLLACDDRIFQVGGVEWSEETCVRRITNSLGLSVEEENRFQILVAEAAARREEEIA